MNWDFPTIMVSAVAVTGLIWVLDVLLLAPKRRRKAEEFEDRGGDPQAVDQMMKEPLLVEYSRSFFPVILVVLVLRSFIVEPFRIPSGSMMPTLLNGDFILVNKYSYGVRLPVINQKIIEIGSPQRGDVAVFRYPKDPSVDYIKRVIGLPGDRVRYSDKNIFINDELVIQESRGLYVATGNALFMMGAERRLEHLGEVDHEILLMGARPAIPGEYRVPEGHYFVMGDNRDNSNDGRMWGFVPEENLVGRAFMIWMNWDAEQSQVLWGRIGNVIE